MTLVVEHTADPQAKLLRRIAPEALCTPSELRRHVVAALRERVQLGDKLAEGAIRVIEQLEQQANRLAWSRTEGGG